MKLPRLIQQVVNGFCAQTDLPHTHVATIVDLIYDIDSETADAFLARPDVTMETKLFPAPVLEV